MRKASEPRSPCLLAAPPPDRPPPRTSSEWPEPSCWSCLSWLRRWPGGPLRPRSTACQSFPTTTLPCPSSQRATPLASFSLATLATLSVRHLQAEGAVPLACSAPWIAASRWSATLASLSAPRAWVEAAAKLATRAPRQSAFRQWAPPLREAPASQPKFPAPLLQLAAAIRTKKFAEHQDA